jgi:hypothetical protein
VAYTSFSGTQAYKIIPTFTITKHALIEDPTDPAKNTHLVPAWLDECERWLERSPITGALPGEAGSLSVHEYGSKGG